METKKCPMCKKNKTRDAWSKGGWNNITYCRPCMQRHNSKKRDKAHKTIMKATNNGKAWWLLQSINAERHFRKSED
tara:strand:+ start:256 stop:483 length:228 start_codon:yes stop_codon:yes gene_type:complete